MAFKYLNHFIELQITPTKELCIMIHSGSRNLGSKVADFYDKKARELNKRWCSSVPKEHDLAFLPITDDYAEHYIDEMDYCMRFAKASRDLMMTRVQEAILSEFPNASFNETLDVHHNYARWENQFGQNVIVHRKGATSARKNEEGLIPGSQGTASYHVIGLGNKESFESCSHGAGRTMSRSKARKELNLEDEIKALDDLGIIHGIRHQKDLDEAASAYKDIDEVMENQKDLVNIVTKLEPIAVLKG